MSRLAREAPAGLGLIEGEEYTAGELYRAVAFFQAGGRAARRILSLSRRDTDCALALELALCLITDLSRRAVSTHPCYATGDGGRSGSGVDSPWRCPCPSRTASSRRI